MHWGNGEFDAGDSRYLHLYNDPFDRLIAAHAIEHSAILISPDTTLSALGASRIW